MNEMSNTNDVAMREYRPNFAIYHPNGKGTGCALRMNLHPAHDRRDGYIMLELATQRTVGDRRAAIPKFPTFDWENRLVVKLGFADLCKMLQVLRGENGALEEGKGLYHRSARYATRIVLRRLTEPIQGYSLEIYRNSADKSDADRNARIVLSPWEALGIALAIEDSIGVVCFGIPKVVVRESIGEIGNEESRDASAA